MKKAILLTAGYALGGLIALIVIIVVIWQIFAPTLPGLRDIIIVGAGFFILLSAFLMSAVAVALLFLALVMYTKLPPLLDKANSMAESGRGTADFVTERVVSPLIKVSAAASGARAAVQTMFRPSNGRAETRTTATTTITETREEV